jgi:hypothetical protein
MVPDGSPELTPEFVPNACVAARTPNLDITTSSGLLLPAAAFCP